MKTPDENLPAGLGKQLVGKDRAAAKFALGFNVGLTLLSDLLNTMA